MTEPITVLTPTGTLGYGFGADALTRGMTLKPDVIAVDAGSTDPGPHYLGSGDTLVSRFSMKRELTELIRAGRQTGIPVIVGSAGGSGSKAHVDWTTEIVRERVFLGSQTRVHAALGADQPLVFQPSRSGGAQALAPGDRVTVHWRRDQSRVLET